MRGFGKRLQRVKGEEIVAQASLLLLYLHSPHLPIFSTSTFVPSLAPVAQVESSKEGADAGLFSPENILAQAAYLAILTLLHFTASRSGEDSSSL